MIFNNLKGSKIIDFNISKTELTAKPNNLKGKRISQINGYTIKTPIASGKDIIARITHNINVDIFYSYLIIVSK